MNSSTFSRHDILDFLIEKDFVYTAQSWFLEKGVDGRISNLEVTDWFHTYFPSHNSFKLFRQLESEKPQFYN
jgi:hypothetical protein